MLKIDSFDKDFYRGADIESREHWIQLRDLGIKSIIDLKSYTLDTSGDERANKTRDAFNIDAQTYVIPMGGVFVPTRLKLLSALYMMKHVPGPTYVHCEAGKDRTGIVVAAHRLRVLKQPWDMVYQDMLDHGFHLAWYWFWLPRLKEFRE